MGLIQAAASVWFALNIQACQTVRSSTLKIELERSRGTATGQVQSFTYSDAKVAHYRAPVYWSLTSLCDRLDRTGHKGWSA
jgi:hypothetical protein